MFTGIVETTGIIQQTDAYDDCIKLRITPTKPFDDLQIGDSVAVNGVCLTVTDFSSDTFDVTIVPETLRLTNLGQLATTHKVNLERSMKANARIGGHYVQGHIDSIGEIIEITPDGKTALLIKVRHDPVLAKYIIKKGYIGLDGMSVTVVETTSSWFTVTLIPHTQEVTIVNKYQLGSHINIEVDILGKYIEKLLPSHH